MKNRPKVGISVIIRKDKRVLLGKRKVYRGKGTWVFPGGHLEFGEEIKECARREVFEEIGLLVKNILFRTLTNDINKREKTHYITLFFTADYDSGKVVNKEPHKSEEWKWFSWNNLPSPLFLPIRNLLKQNFNPFR